MRMKMPGRAVARRSAAVARRTVRSSGSGMRGAYRAALGPAMGSGRRSPVLAKKAAKIAAGGAIVGGAGYGAYRSQRGRYGNSPRQGIYKY